MFHFFTLTNALSPYPSYAPPIILISVVGNTNVWGMSQPSFKTTGLELNWPKIDRDWRDYWDAVCSIEGRSKYNQIFSVFSGTGACQPASGTLFVIMVVMAERTTLSIEEATVIAINLSAGLQYWDVNWTHWHTIHPEIMASRKFGASFTWARLLINLAWFNLGTWDFCHDNVYEI